MAVSDGNCVPSNRGSLEIGTGRKFEKNEHTT